MPFTGPDQFRPCVKCGRPTSNRGIAYLAHERMHNRAEARIHAQFPDVYAEVERTIEEGYARDRAAHESNAAHAAQAEDC